MKNLKYKSATINFEKSIKWNTWKLWSKIIASNNRRNKLKMPFIATFENSVYLSIYRKDTHHRLSYLFLRMHHALTYSICDTWSNLHTLLRWKIVLCNKYPVFIWLCFTVIPNCIWTVFTVFQILIFKYTFLLY